MAGLLVMASQASGQVVTNAYDTASNYTSFSGSLGYGFDDWILSSTGGGTYIREESPKLFAIWNRTANAQTTALRAFDVPLQNGGSFSVDLQMRRMERTNDRSGVELQDADGNVLFSYWHQGGDTLDGQYFDISGTNTAVGFRRDLTQKDTLTFTLSGANDYTITNLTGSKITGKLAGGSSISQVVFFRANSDTAPRDGQDFFFDNLLITYPAALAPKRRTPISGQVYQDRNAPLEARVEDLFARLTQDQKIRLLSGTSFLSTPISRVGLPSLSMADAGQGCVGGVESTRGPATAFPSGVAMAASWNTAMVNRVAHAIGVETRNKGTGTQMLLGPAINIHRSPLGGRNGEYFSEDPYLTARLAVDYIQGMQSSGCSACVKHFVAYNQESQRYAIDVNVGERALREIYMPGFEASVKEGHAWAVMSSYNQINGFKASANRYLMVDVLKKCWGFDGLLVSDWGGVQDTVGPLNSGNDLEMPGQEYMTFDKVKSALKKGLISKTNIDDSVRRLLRTIIRVGLLDGPVSPDHSLVNCEDHKHLALEAAVQGMVLLKNSNSVLPLQTQKISSIAVIGPAAAGFQLCAAGSPKVTPFYSVSALGGLRKRSGADIRITYSPGAREGEPIPASAFGSAEGKGLKAEFFPNLNLEGQPFLTRNDPQIQFDWSDAPPVPGLPEFYSVRWTGDLTPPSNGSYVLALTADDGCRLFLDDKILIDHWVDSGAVTKVAEVDLVAGRAYKLRVEYFQHGGNSVAQLNWKRAEEGDYADAKNAARSSDVALVFVSTRGTEGETSDRPSMSLPGNQDDLIRAVCAANSNTIVILNNGTPVSMPWVDHVAGIIEAWFPGQEGGNAIASVLFGDINPSGKLPTTFGVRREDYPDFGNFPGVNGHVNYDEGIFVGYRHFDKAGVAPLFPFGHGLSYTSYKYSNLKLLKPEFTSAEKVIVSVDVSNVGDRAGAEVVQAYIHDPAPKVDKAPRELKAFQRVELAPGQTKTVTFEVQPRLLAYCDVPGKQWKADAGTYELQVGASSRDIRLQAPLRLTETYTEAIPFMEEQKPASPDPMDLAAYRPTFSSSSEPNNDYGGNASNSTDGNSSTYWTSKPSDSQWLMVDLGKMETINRVRIKWAMERFGAEFAKAYKIQTSLDGQAWGDAFGISNGQGGVEDIKLAPVTAKWVRLMCEKRAENRTYKVVSLEVFAGER